MDLLMTMTEGMLHDMMRRTPYDQELIYRFYYGTPGTPFAGAYGSEVSMATLEMKDMLMRYGLAGGVRNFTVEHHMRANIEHLLAARQRLNDRIYERWQKGVNNGR